MLPTFNQAASSWTRWALSSQPSISPTQSRVTVMLNCKCSTQDPHCSAMLLKIYNQGTCRESQGCSGIMKELPRDAQRGRLLAVVAGSPPCNSNQLYPAGRSTWGTCRTHVLGLGGPSCPPLSSPDLCTFLALKMHAGLGKPHQQVYHCEYKVATYEKEHHNPTFTTNKQTN